MMKTWSKYIIGAFVIIGGCIGTTIITPKLGVSENIGAISGILLGIAFSLLVPNLWVTFLETINTEHQEAIQQNRYISVGETFTHPTYLPFTLGIIWFVTFLVIVIIFKLDTSQKWLSIIMITPFLISLGWSGLEIVRRKEMITGGWFGYVVKKTQWAIVFGSILIIIGFGGSIIYVIGVIFNW